MQIVQVDHNIDLKDELLDFMCGKRLGVGVYRTVYEFNFNRQFVIKVADETTGRAENLLELRVWREIYQSPAEKWFAEVLEVSCAGQFLIQRKVEQLPKSQYPKEIPAFFTDTKYSNFGWIEGKGFVCCDFGSFNLFRGISVKMKKASWWE